MRAATLIEKIDSLKLQAMADLREEVIRAANDETEVDAEGVVALLGQAGLDSRWFAEELARCRARLQAQQTLKDVEREESPTGRVAAASEARSQASQELKSLLIRHKEELRAAQAKLRAASSKNTVVYVSALRRRKEATQFLLQSIGQEHREKLAAAERDLELLQSRLTHLESEVPHDDDIRRAKLDLEHFESRDFSPEREDQIAGLNAKIEDFEQEQQTHFARIQQLRHEVESRKQELEQLRQLSLDPVKSF